MSKMTRVYFGVLQHYTRDPVVLKGYNDANWISNVKDSKSYSGYVFTLGGAAVSWKSSKQMVS